MKNMKKWIRAIPENALTEREIDTLVSIVYETKSIYMAFRLVEKICKATPDAELLKILLDDFNLNYFNNLSNIE